MGRRLQLQYLSPCLICPLILCMHAAFLASLSRVHTGWEGASKDITAAQFNDTFCAFLMVDHELESLNYLGVKCVDLGPFGNCPICSQGYEGGAEY